MLSKLKKSDNKGFTIIEVMIVLAIAGLILLIVFLAVPALQRSSRNTQRKNDAAAISGAVANYISNNGGSLPSVTNPDANANTIDICAAAACPGAANKETAKLGYYANTTVAVSFHAYAANLTVPDASTVYIVAQHGCNSSNTGLDATVNPRTAAILYALENGSTTTQQCVEQ